MNLKRSFIRTILTGALLISGLVSCGNKGPYEGDANWIDYAHNGSVTLNLNYNQKDFYVDGVGQFTLAHAIDGDTAHFTPMVDSTHSGLMKARFYGIDTPESTGKIQQYGHAASEYTKAILNEANENGTIVVSSAQNDYGAPNPDSTGSRYVSLVWVNLTKKNAGLSELYCLNLMIVQKGLSWVKNVQDMPQYADTFYKAEQQAKDYKLNLHSGKDDGWTDTSDFETVDLISIKDALANSLADPDYENPYDNKNIKVCGTVAGFSNHILYLQDFILRDEDDPNSGEYVGINIFVGMGGIPSKFTKLNTYIQVCGTSQYTDNYGFQVTNTQGRFPYGTPTNDADARILLKPEENIEHRLDTLEYTKSELNDVANAKNPYNLDCLNCRVSISETLTVNRVYVSESTSKELTIYFEGCDFNCYVPFNYYGDPDNRSYRWVLESDFVGRQFTLEGVYVYHKTQKGEIKFQIIPSKGEEFVWVH